MVNFSCLLHGQWLMYIIFKLVSHPGQWLLVNDCFVQAKKTRVSYVHQWLESRKSNGQGYLYLMCVFVIKMVVWHGGIIVKYTKYRNQIHPTWTPRMHRFNARSRFPRLVHYYWTCSSLSTSTQWKLNKTPVSRMVWWNLWTVYIGFCHPIWMISWVVMDYHNVYIVSEFVL